MSRVSPSLNGALIWRWMSASFFLASAQRERNVGETFRLPSGRFLLPPARMYWQFRIVVLPNFSTHSCLVVQPFTGRLASSSSQICRSSGRACSTRWRFALRVWFALLLSFSMSARSFATSSLTLSMLGVVMCFASSRNVSRKKKPAATRPFCELQQALTDPDGQWTTVWLPPQQILLCAQLPECVHQSPVGYLVVLGRSVPPVPHTLRCRVRAKSRCQW